MSSSTIGSTTIAALKQGRAADPSPPPCFVAGTRILTARGDVAVEHLRAGEALVLANGQTAPLVWLGHRRIDLLLHPQRERDLPVLIEASAIADGMPRRDLMLSPDHALLLEGHLIPARALINGVTIRQVGSGTITYYHVELEEHGI
ncbi:MAG: hypothetical protein B7X01_03370, partial [Acidiphilium sp. 21-62-4]